MKNFSLTSLKEFLPFMQKKRFISACCFFVLNLTALHAQQIKVLFLEYLPNSRIKGHSNYDQSFTTNLQAKENVSGLSGMTLWKDKIIINELNELQQNATIYILSLKGELETHFNISRKNTLLGGLSSYLDPITVDGMGNLYISHSESSKAEGGWGINILEKYTIDGKKLWLRNTEGSSNLTSVKRLYPLDNGVLALTGGNDDVLELFTHSEDKDKSYLFGRGKPTEYTRIIKLKAYESFRDQHLFIYEGRTPYYFRSSKIDKNNYAFETKDVFSGVDKQFPLGNKNPMKPFFPIMDEKKNIIVSFTTIEHKQLPEDKKVRRYFRNDLTIFNSDGEEIQTHTFYSDSLKKQISAVPIWARNGKIITYHYQTKKFVLSDYSFNNVFQEVSIPIKLWKHSSLIPHIQRFEQDRFIYRLSKKHYAVIEFSE